MIAENNSPDAGDAQSDEPDAAQRPTVLVVEDDPDFRRMLTTTISLRFGYRVLVATDGRTAVSTASTEQPDLILMDMAMPHLNGVAATELLKQDAATRSIPIIAFSNYARIATWRNKALDAGVTRCLDKAIRMDELEQVIADVLREASAKS